MGKKIFLDKGHGGDDTRQANFAVLRETSMPALMIA